MKENNEEKKQETTSAIIQAEQFVVKNKKAITITACAILAVILIVWAYVGLYSRPHQKRAAEDMFAAEQWFQQGDYEKALNGDDQYMGFLSVIDQYGSTKSGNLAKYYAGTCQLNLGQYDEAIANLKSYKGKDTFTEAEALMLIGDCYAEQGNAKEAASYYDKAASHSPNFIITPIALWKAGMMQMLLGNNEAAVKRFQQIKDNYPESPEYGEADKYIAYCENR